MHKLHPWIINKMAVSIEKIQQREWSPTIQLVFVHGRMEAKKTNLPIVIDKLRGYQGLV